MIAINLEVPPFGYSDLRSLPLVPLVSTEAPHWRSQVRPSLGVDVQCLYIDPIHAVPELKTLGAAGLVSGGCQLSCGIGPSERRLNIQIMTCVMGSYY